MTQTDDANAARLVTMASGGSPAAGRCGRRAETDSGAERPPSNWQTSIVDLLTLLDMDSSLTVRKELANELNFHVGADGSAENIALHKAVMAKLAENGGKVPADLRG